MISIAEIFGPKIPLDLMLVMPCSGNTLAKLTYGINDNAVTMACKSTLRNENNVVLAIATNDALSNSGKNIMQILNTKHFYLVPMYHTFNYFLYFLNQFISLIKTSITS